MSQSFAYPLKSCRVHSLRNTDINDPASTILYCVNEIKRFIHRFIYICFSKIKEPF